MTKKELLEALKELDDDAVIYCDSFDGLDRSGGYVHSVDYNEKDRLIEINFGGIRNDD